MELRWQGTEFKAQSLKRHKNVEPEAEKEAVAMILSCLFSWMACVRDFSTYLYPEHLIVKSRVTQISGMYPPVIILKYRQLCVFHIIDHTISPYWNPFLFEEWDLQYLELSVTRKPSNYEMSMYENQQEVQIIITDAVKQTQTKNAYPYDWIRRKMSIHSLCWCKMCQFKKKKFLPVIMKLCQKEKINYSQDTFSWAFYPHPKYWCLCELCICTMQRLFLLPRTNRDARNIW